MTTRNATPTGRVEPPRPPAIPRGLPPEAVYRERHDRFAAERDQLTVRWERVSNLRLLVFVVAIAFLIWGFWTRSFLPIAPGAALLGGFIVLVGWHGALGVARARASDLTRINEEALKRLARVWADLPLRQPFTVDPTHPYAVDLDIFGHASLFHLIASLRTPVGERTLARWLLAPAAPEVVANRQRAVAELVPLLELRDEIAIFSRRVADSRLDPEPVLAWAEGEPWLRERRPLVWIARVSPPILGMLLVAQIAGLIPYPLWLPFLAVNVIVCFMLGSRAYRTVSRLWEQEGALRQYAVLCELVVSGPFQSRALTRMQADLNSQGEPAHQRIRRLRALTSFTIPRSAVLYWPIQLVTLWDVQVMAALESWQMRDGGSVRTWLAAVGEVEALCALAALAQDNPSWTFPDVRAAERVISGRALGHPLLPPAARVDNDCELGPPGTVLLVTGSNMSGKSTLLRAIGVNLVLAGTGAPICADALIMPPVELWTSMRVQDSLAQGVSFFMAELQRLKAVVDAARRGTAAGERTFCYLLDEILQGTNTFERQIAARRILAHLVDVGAIGAVSTHDLTLADASELNAALRLVHFTETIAAGPRGPEMTFDYALRPDLATSSNALRLMEIVGLDLPGT